MRDGQEAVERERRQVNGALIKSEILQVSQDMRFASLTLFP